MPAHSPSREDPVAALSDSRAVRTSGPVSPLDVFPHDPSLFERSRSQWLFGDWAALTQCTADSIEHHPDRARLSLLVAAAHQQSGNHAAARLFARLGTGWGCDRAFASRVLVAGVYQTLGRAAALAGQDGRAEGLLQRSVPSGVPAPEARRLLQLRADQAAQQLKAARAALAAKKPPPAKAVATQAPAWLQELVTACLAATDVHAQVDSALAHSVKAPNDRMRLHMLLADAFLARNDRMTALHFLATARDGSDGADEALRAELARKLIAVGQADEAMDLVMARSLAGAAQDALSEQEQAALLAAYRKARTAAQAKSEHGHEVLLAHLRAHWARLAGHLGGRRATLIEIGTTRENVPGQGSTRKIAEYCKQQGLHFITVDMDPHNAQMAQHTFESLGVDFEAVAMKGEDFLRQYEGPLDFVFLDAYDFDHGMHSELRQSRYEQFLGSRIDEQECHRMHLDCAQSVMKKLSPFGLVCVDDTWLDNGRWTAKGTLAMPYLLESGFQLLEARNRSALLSRAAGAAQG